MCATCAPAPALEPRLAEPATVFAPDEVRAELLDWNRRRPVPSPVCPDCKFPFHRGDRDTYFPRRCSSCGAVRLDKIIARICRRLGRRRGLRALRRLAK